MASAVDRQIQSLLQQAGRISGQMNAARAQFDAAKARREQYELRLRQVRTVKNNLANSFDGHVSSIRSSQDNARGQIESGMTGPKHSSAIASTLQRDREKDTESDGCGSGIHASLQQEIARCEREIQSAQNAMNQAHSHESALSSQHARAMNNARRLSRSEDATIRVW